MTGGQRRRWVICWLTLTAWLAACGASAQHYRVDINGRAAAALSQHSVYIAPSFFQSASARAAERRRLQREISWSAGQGVTEKIGFVSGVPKPFHTVGAAADSLRLYLDLSGVLVLVSPSGIGVSSDNLSTSQERRIEQRALQLCHPSYERCALAASRSAVALIARNTQDSEHAATAFVVIMGAGLMIAALVLVLFSRRKRGRAATGDSVAV